MLTCLSVCPNEFWNLTRSSKSLCHLLSFFPDLSLPLNERNRGRGSRHVNKKCFFIPNFSLGLPNGKQFISRFIQVLLSFLPAVKHIYFHFNKFRTIFLMFCCSLSILLSSNSFCTVHLIQTEESNMTRPISAMSRVNLYKELIEVALVLVPRQKLIKTDITTWKY